MDAEEWLEKICEKFGESFSFPPYPPYFPQEFRIPDSIVKSWVWSTYYPEKGDSHFKRVLFIPPKPENYDLPRRGSYFNGVVGYESKKGIKKVFLPGDKDILWTGSVVYNGSFFGNEPLKKGEVCRGMVYRFEILYTFPQDRLFECIAIPHTFNKENFLENLMNCNYLKNQVPDEKTFGTNPFRKRKRQGKKILQRNKSRRKNIDYSPEIDPAKIDHRSPWEKGKRFRKR